MNLKKCLGIHYSRQQISAVLVEKQGDVYCCLSDYQIAIPSGGDTAESKTDEIERLDGVLDDLCDQALVDGEKRPAAAMSIGGRFYQSQYYHSEFTDDDQIRQTLRFDVEDEFIVNAESIALGYQKGSDAKQGRHLTVHMIRRDWLGRLLDRFYTKGLDAMIAQPDVDGWYSYVRYQAGVSISSPVLFLAAADGLVYMMVIDSHFRAILSRSFLIDHQDMASMILRECRRSMIQLGDDQRPVELYYHRDGLGEKVIGHVSRGLTLPARELPLSDPLKAFATGAAISWLGEESPNDFRSDGMAPQSLMKSKQKALFVLSGAVSVFFVVLMLVFYLHAWKYRTIEEEARAELNQAWVDAGIGDTVPDRVTKITKGLERHADMMRAKSQSFSALSTSDSASHTLILVLKMFNDLYGSSKEGDSPKPFDLRIDSLQLDKANARLAGSVRNMDDLVKMRNIIIEKDSRLEVENWDFVLSSESSRSGGGNRRNFNLPLRVVTAKKMSGHNKQEETDDR